MNDYKNITFWENARRVEGLIKFRNHVIDYFNNCRKHDLRSHLVEGEKARRVRSEINLMLVEVEKILIAANVNYKMKSYPPSAVGGRVQHIDVLANIPHLHRYNITPADAISCLECAIGVYQSDQRKSLFRTFNIFWWIGRLLYWFSRIPFNIFKASGFNSARTEGSTFGRLVKAILYLIPIFASLLLILYHMEWLDDLKSALGIANEVGFIDPPGHH